MVPWTDHMPKAMLPLGRTPVISFAVDELVVNQIRRATVVTSPPSDVSAAALRETVRLEWTRSWGTADGLSFASQFRSHPGTAAAILSAFDPRCESDVPEPILVMLADDVIVEWPTTIPSVLPSRMIAAYADDELHVDAVVAVKRVQPALARNYGIVRLAPGSSVVESIVEKPEEDVGNIAIVGRYVLSPGFLDRVQAAGRRHDPVPPTGVELTWALEEIIAAGGRVVAVTLDDCDLWQDTGNPEGYFAAFRAHADRELTRG